MKKINNSQKKKKKVVITWRFQLICFTVFVIFLAILSQVAYLQLIESPELIEQGNLRSLRVEKIYSDRGAIYDRNGVLLAVSVQAKTIVADPKKIFSSDSLNKQKKYWDAFFNVLHLNRNKFEKKLNANKNKRFMYVARQVTSDVGRYIQKLKLDGIYLKQTSKRYYPSAEIASQLIGVTGIDGHGLEGIEKKYDKWLTGHPGSKTYRKDGNGNIIENISLKDNQPGKPIQLSIDQRIQTAAYKAAKQYQLDYDCDSVQVVMVDVKTGEILALVSSPSFNPNNRNDFQSYRMQNKAITDIVEPGSTIKPFTILAALKSHVATTKTLVHIPSRTWKIDGSTITDTETMDKYSSLKEILMRSSNIGSAKLALATPVKNILMMESGFGLGRKTNLELDGEASGTLHLSRKNWNTVDKSRLGFGYGVSFTAIQLAKAYAALGNHGVVNNLSLLKLKDKTKGKRVADRKDVDSVLDMLEAATNAAEGGGVFRADVKGYRIGAKTGTALVVDGSDGRYGNNYNVLTAGLAPMSNPQLALVVVVRDPKGDSYYASQVAAPLFSEVMKDALQILNIPPDQN